MRTTALVQMTAGGPDPIYHGGLLHTRLRYYDPQAGRPGLPEQTAALVTAIEEDEVTVDLVNLDPREPRRIQLQAGALAEHEFTQLKETGEDQVHQIDGPHFEIELAAGGHGNFEIGMRRYRHRPTYEQP